MISFYLYGLHSNFVTVAKGIVSQTLK